MPDSIRFKFATQLPRDDGCGVFVLQMLTGRSYDDLASMIDWGAQKNHYTTSKELRAVLRQLGWETDELRSAVHWSDIKGVAVVHVEGDHFVLMTLSTVPFMIPGTPTARIPSLTTFRAIFWCSCPQLTRRVRRTSALDFQAPGAFCVPKISSRAAIVGG